jgi:2-amino-4-hydroxy-6-hydroxymethyldihydropteridine diphosphokinase
VTVAYLGLGSNLGDRAAMLSHAIESLDWGDVRVIARSGVYETDPVGGPPGQPPFLNQVVAVDSRLDARALWERCSAVEAALGRSREREERWGPRAIDIDLLLFGEGSVVEPDLVVPHPRLAERAFVIVPLAEIAPEARIGPAGTAAAVRARIDASGVRAVEDA